MQVQAYIAPRGDAAFDRAAAGPTIFFDLSDLLHYLPHHTTLSGIQRVQCEIVSGLLDIPNPLPVRFVVLNEDGRLDAIEAPALLELIEDLRTGATTKPVMEFRLRTLLKQAVHCTIRPEDIFLTLGAFWNVKGMGALLQGLKNSGVVIGVFIHDILPITASEYFQVRESWIFAKAVSAALTFADFILTTSDYNRTSLVEHMASRKLVPLPIHTVPLGHELSIATAESKISGIVAGIAGTDYVLCVGTIEARKNPAYLFHIWKKMLASGRPHIPRLVFVGRMGWLVQDFLSQLKSSKYLDGRIVLLNNATDVELELLYRNCILTMFPSYVEGWGLPVGESLAHGKVCLCSATGGIPSVGGEFVDYIDPYNVCDGLDHLLRYLDDAELRRDREREITERFEPRPWKKTTEHLLKSAQALARQARPFEAVAAITLPPGRYLPISADPADVSLPAPDRMLCAELACVSGWHTPEETGVGAAQQTAVLRFRTDDLTPGTRINLVLRLKAVGRDCRIGFRTGSGAETTASIPSGFERLVALSCQVEPEKLVTAHLSSLGAAMGVASGEEIYSDSASWILRGILYFDPQRVAREAGKKSKPLKASHMAESAAKEPEAQSNVDHPHPLKPTSPADRILLRPAATDNHRRTSSFGAFLQMTDCYWPTSFPSVRDAPVFADHADRRAFFSGFGNSATVPEVGRITDSVKLMRRSDQFVSTSRFSEGSLFDRSGVWREWGYLDVSSSGRAPWLSKDSDGIWVSENSLATAPYYDGSFLIFYNGNLHNYYHWLIEGMLGLDLLSRALGLDPKVKIVLPKSIDIAALFDHRESIRALGFGEYEILEVGAGLVKVREAIWVENNLVQSMPAFVLKDFQQRVAALYAGLRTPRNRRLLIARKGPTRKINNIEEVETVLSRNDFETVYLEGMSVVDQILLFQSAEFVVGPHGAGLSNLVFCEPGTKVIELMPCVEMRPFFWQISEKLGLVHGLQFCAPVEGSGFQASINVNTKKLQALIRMLDAHL
jgi:glycosyltransferase involved in cell wall biosynthesis/capsular polysaccharide biosynthesis protein